MKRKLSEFLATVELAGAFIPYGDRERMSRGMLKAMLANNDNQLYFWCRDGVPREALLEVMNAYGIAVLSREVQNNGAAINHSELSKKLEIDI